jgi:magnesium-transporting ATPase (P-type)
VKFWHRESEKPIDESILKHLSLTEDDGENDPEALSRETTEELYEQSENEKSQPIGEEQNFNALSCFGWNENKTDKWLIKCAHVWFGIMSLMWFLFGASTFAPIIFISNKVNVIFKSKTKSMLCAIAIYAILTALIVVFMATRNTPKG